MTAYYLFNDTYKQLFQFLVSSFNNRDNEEERLLLDHTDYILQQLEVDPNTSELYSRFMEGTDTDMICMLSKQDNSVILNESIPMFRSLSLHTIWERIIDADANVHDESEKELPLVWDKILKIIPHTVALSTFGGNISPAHDEVVEEIKQNPQNTPQEHAINVLQKMLKGDKIGGLLQDILGENQDFTEVVKKLGCVVDSTCAGVPEITKVSRELSSVIMENGEDINKEMREVVDSLKSNNNPEMLSEIQTVLDSLKTMDTGNIQDMCSQLLNSTNIQNDHGRGSVVNKESDTTETYIKDMSDMMGSLSSLDINSIKDMYSKLMPKQ